MIGAGSIPRRWRAASRRTPDAAGGRLTFERGIPDEVRLDLAEKGHQVRSQVAAHGGYQAIWRRDDPLVYFGGSDPRKDGAAIGY